MKKSLLNKSVLAAGVLSVAVSANAGMGEIKPYVGVGLEHNTYSVNKDVTKVFDKGFKSNGLGFVAPVIGVKFHDNFGLEAGYSFNKKLVGKRDTKADTISKVRSMFLDLVGFMPVADQFELIGGIGMGKVNVKKSSGFDAAEQIKNKYNWRAKIGAQYNFNSNFATRLVATYQQVNNKYIDDNTATPVVAQKLIKNIKSIGLGVTYTFC